MTGPQVQTLTTDRFTMRPLRREDAAALFPTLSDPAQCLYLTRPAFESEEELWGWLADPDWPGLTWIAEDARGTVAGRFITVAAPHGGADGGVEEIGYIVCAEAQGQGVAKECTTALIAHRFASGVRKITAEVDARNTPSVRLLESLGFTKEAHFREHEVTHAGMCDVLWYGMLRGD